MAIPYRGKTETATYFITANTFEKQQLLQSDRMATLLITVLHHYREQKKYLLHEYVVMPDHFHLLITPRLGTTLERALQLIKGGFSYRAKKQFGFTGEIWQTSYVDRRVRDYREYQQFRRYIYRNPVKRLLVSADECFPYSSAAHLAPVDAMPQRLKPLELEMSESQA